MRIFLVAGGLVACARPEAGVRVAAAASLADVLPVIGAAFAATGEPEPAFTFDATSRLVGQIRGGAGHEVFVSADAVWMDDLAASSEIDVGSRRDIASNTLVVVVPRGAPAPARLAALADPRFSRLALAGESVPAGRYGRAALAYAGVLPSGEGKIVAGDSVRTALGWVARGEADAGIVYATDARVEPGVEVAFSVPAEATPPVRYPAAALAGARPAARRFLDHLSGPGQDDLRAYGFGPP